MDNQKTWWAPIWKGLIMDQKATHYRKMKTAIWLFLYLVLNADRKTGGLIRKVKTVTVDMGVGRGTVLRWLGVLRREGYIETRSTGRFLTIQLKKWRALQEVRNIRHEIYDKSNFRGCRSETSKSGQKQDNAAQLKPKTAPGFNPNDKAITKDLLNIDIDSKNSTYSNRTLPEDFHPEDQEELLALDLAQSLDDLPGLPLYLSYARKYPQALLRQILGTVKEVPPEKLKKNRGALFNYLVQKHAPKSRYHSGD